MTFVGSRKHLQDKIESVLLRRLFDKRIEGYTLETAEEIMKIIDGHQFQQRAEP